MHICLLGATGRTGKEVMKRALQAGHAVTALVREPSSLQLQHDRLHVQKGDALQAVAIAEAMQGCSHVVSALGTDGQQVLAKSMPYIIDAMIKQQVTRIVTVGTAGILQARSQPELYRFQSAESRRKTTKAAEDHLQAYLLLQQSKLAWTIVCPTHLVDGEAVGRYRVERDMLPEEGTTISVGDTAHFVYHELLQQQYLHARVGISY